MSIHEMPEEVKVVFLHQIHGVVYVKFIFLKTGKFHTMTEESFLKRYPSKVLEKSKKKRVKTLKYQIRKSSEGVELKNILQEIDLLQNTIQGLECEGVEDSLNAS